MEENEEILEMRKSLKEFKAKKDEYARFINELKNKTEISEYQKL